MKNRPIPFGYRIEEGRIALEPAESPMVTVLFEQYRQGDSLGNLARRLTENAIAYLPGKCRWDKSRVKRILEEPRYMGRDGYPALIDEELFEAVQIKKSAGYTRRDRPAANTEFLKPYVVCAQCGKPLHRWVIKKCSQNPVEWRCPACRLHWKIGDGEWLDSLTVRLNQLIAKPELAEFPESADGPVLSLEAQRMTNDIYRQLEAGVFDRNELKDLILFCAAEKYKGLRPLQHKTEGVKAELLRAAPLSQFSEELFVRIVRRVLVHPDRQIELELRNGRILGKEDLALGNDCCQNRDGHSAVG